MKLAWAARWGLSLALALGCLAATGWFAQPGGSGGRSAPPARMGLVRLTSPAVAYPASPVEAPALSAPSGKKAGEPRRERVATQLKTQPAQFVAAPPQEHPNMAMEHLPRLEESRPTAEVQSPASGGDEEKSPANANKATPAAASPRGQSNGAVSIAAVKRTPYVRTSDTERAPTGAAGREVKAHQLDAGFGLRRPVLPGYPPLAKRLEKAGRVRLELAIDQEGRVYRINVLNETGGWGFGSSAATAYRNARFTRPTVQGRPVHVLWRKTVIFRP